MSFIAKHVVTADERLIYMARLHWIYTIKGLLWLGLTAGIAFQVYWIILPIYGTNATYRPLYVHGVSLGHPAQWFFWAILLSGLLVSWTYLIKALTTEIALTNVRVILKSGWIATEAQEVDLSEIKSETVHQGLFGRFLGYGWIHMDCRFIGDFDIPVIRNPYRFLQVLNKTRGHKHDDVIE